MNELHRIFTAVALAVAITAPAPAADDTKPTNEEKLQQQKDSAQEPAKQQTTGDLTEQEQAYLSALKKCEPLGAAEKQQCINQTKKEFNHQ
jgi:hypothetical protein